MGRKSTKINTAAMNSAAMPDMSGGSISKQIDSYTNSNLRNASSNAAATSSINVTGMPNDYAPTGSINQTIDNTTRQNLSSANSKGTAYAVNSPTAGPAQTLTEKDIAADCLRSEIFLLQSYNSACIESANQNVFSGIKNILNEEHDIHYEIFNIMKQKGWYPVSNANPQDINNTRSMFQG
ncbi:spore coat protein [Thermoanaerobacterium thermosaccharolyticum]|uniref:spore coat protein n=1 Tax=Thermoanaerobacterium thermosaccharolyticum TaxID=1517 RepID=UPI00123BE179|nr:spore coat protein [Thermoanaerobacterium thermosaccharolyticum]KAA5806812.1 spore coat protein [Thermoanaerobacterium thermosaccharolyticum]